MERFKHIGEIVIAETLDLVEDPLYKVLGRVKTGPLAGKECFVSYLGSPDFCGKDVVVRLDQPKFRLDDLRLNGLNNLSQDNRAGHFVTSEIPESFEFALPDQAILYGIWEARMKGDFQIPRIRKVRDFYYIGRNFLFLHYAHLDSWLIGFRIGSDDVQLYSHEDGRLRNPHGALRKYLYEIDYNASKSPRMSTIDENANVERVLSFFRESGLRSIQMQPQQ